VDLVYASGDGTRLMVYVPGLRHTPWPTSWSRTWRPPHAICARIKVDEYDTPELKTVGGVANVGDKHYAWFHDPDDNVVGIHDRLPVQPAAAAAPARVDRTSARSPGRPHDDEPVGP
jgi:hypothetical protein